MTNVPYDTQRAATRTEIVDLLDDLFDHPMRKEDLLTAAVKRHARPAVIDVLTALPNRIFPSPREIWLELPEVPVGA
jgi:hypothetical protein